MTDSNADAARMLAAQLKRARKRAKRLGISRWSVSPSQRISFGIFEGLEVQINAQIELNGLRVKVGFGWEIFVGEERIASSLLADFSTLDEAELVSLETFPSIVRFHVASEKAKASGLDWTDIAAVLQSEVDSEQAV